MTVGEERKGGGLLHWLMDLVKKLVNPISWNVFWFNSIKSVVKLLRIGGGVDTDTDLCPTKGKAHSESAVLRRTGRRGNLLTGLRGCCCVLLHHNNNKQKQRNSKLGQHCPPGGSGVQPIESRPKNSLAPLGHDFLVNTKST